MSDAQFEPLSLPELKDLLAKVDAAIAAGEAQLRATLKEEFRQMAEDAGFTLAELFQHRELTVKFRDPGDNTRTWSGRGRMPGWLSEQLKGGARLDDFRI